MHISVVAVDFDGTISQGDQLAPEAGRTLRQWRRAGRLAVLVSGRPFEFLRALQQREQAFDLIVAENGAVLYDPHRDEMRLPFGQVPSELVDTLVALDIPLWRGTAIAGTRLPYDDAAWVASRELGLPVHVETNRNEVMLLPPGASKGAGLRHLLRREGLSPRNVLAFGDGENDHSLLQVAEVRVAVANAVEGLQAIADHVTSEAGPAGVAHFIQRHLLDRKPFDFAVRNAHHFSLGTADNARLNAHDLVDREILIAGGSGQSKSWLGCQLAEGLMEGGYQLLALDPLGELSALSDHASCLSLAREDVPAIHVVVQLLAETDLSLALDLSHLPTPEEAVLYTTGLLRHVLEIRHRLGKPHWILIDEAQDLLGGPQNPARLPLLQSFESFGVCLITWQPSHLDPALLEQMHGFVLTRHRLRQEAECLRQIMAGRGLQADDLLERLAELGARQALIWGLTSLETAEFTVLGLGAGPRVLPGVQRLHRYLEGTVASSKQFYFHDEGRHSLPAGNLAELIERVRNLDPAVIAYHFQRGDFSRWVRDVLHDPTLARWLDRLCCAELSGEELRLAFLDTLEQRLRLLEQLL
jgi:hypothetical protein